MLAENRMLETGCFGRSGGAIPTGQTTLVYQLEYHMKTTVKSRFARPAVAAAMLAWLTFGGSQAVRADDSDILAPPGQDMILVSAKTMNELEQRVIFLEETVAALTESWQHIDTHRLCVSDDSGATETCISKPQLDALLIQLAQAKISQPSVAEVAAVAPPAEPVEIAATTPPSSEPTIDPGTEPTAEPTTVVGENLTSDQQPEFTGTIAPAAHDSSAGPATGAAVLSYPKVEIYEEEPAARSDDL
jgi:hypothetical protein